MPQVSRRTFLSSVLLFLLFSNATSAAPPKKLFLLGQGPDGHPPQTHEYMAGLRILAKCLKPVTELDVTMVQADGAWKEGPELLDRADGVVLYLAEGARWISAEPKRKKAFERLAERGGGIVGLHWAIGTREAGPIDGYLQLVGGCHGGPDRKYKVLEEDVRVVDPEHAITKGIRDFRIRDEFYYRLKFVKPEGAIRPILQVPIDGKAENVAWAWQRPDGGRSFGFSGLHFHENWRQAEYRRLVAQAVLWTLKLSVPKEGLPVELNEDDFKLSQRGSGKKR